MVKVKKTRSEGVSRHEVVIAFPAVRVPRILAPFQGFVDFIRDQGVVGIAIGLVLGTQIKVLVDSLVASFINPLIGLMLPGNNDLPQKTFTLAINSKTAVFGYGAFLAQLISFIAVAFVVYMIVKALKLDKLTKKDPKKETGNKSKKSSNKK